MVFINDSIGIQCLKQKGLNCILKVKFSSFLIQTLFKPIKLIGQSQSHAHCHVQTFVALPTKGKNVNIKVQISLSIHFRLHQRKCSKQLNLITAKSSWPITISCPLS